MADDVIARWSAAVEPLRAAMLEHGLHLPERYVAKSRWQACLGGAYWLAADAPILALFAAAGTTPIVWRLDAGRLMTEGQRQRVANVIATCPLTPSDGRDLVRPAHPRAAATRAASPDPTPSIEAAQRFLAGFLSGGPREARDIQEAATRAGFTLITLRRAKRAMGVVVARSGFGPRGIWKWQLH